MAEAPPAPSPMSDDDCPQQQEKQVKDLQEASPALTPEAEAAAAASAAASSAPAPTERNEELEVAIRASLGGPERDLGRLCKTLGEAFCLCPLQTTPARVEGYDSGSDTTSPADQEHSSCSSSGSETGGDNAAADPVSSGALRSAKRIENTDALQTVAAAARVPPDLLARAWSALAKWRDAISEGDLLDVYNSTEGEWYLGKVLHFWSAEEMGAEQRAMELGKEEEEGEGIVEQELNDAVKAVGRGGGDDDDGGEPAAAAAARRDQHDRAYLRIHYQGWPNKYDETLPRDSPNLQPVHTHSKRPKKKKSDRPKRRAKEVREWIREDEFGNIVARGIVGEDDPYDDKNLTGAGVADDGGKDKAANVEGATTNRYGRVVVPRVNLSTPKGKGKTREGGGEPGGGGATGGVGGDGGDGGDDVGAAEGDGKASSGEKRGDASKGKKRSSR